MQETTLVHGSARDKSDDFKALQEPMILLGFAF